MFEPAHMQQCGGQIDVRPTQATDFGHAESMPVHEQHQRSVTMAVPADLPGSTKQALHLGGHQVLTGTPIGILGFRGGNFAENDGWGITPPRSGTRMVPEGFEGHTLPKNSRSRSGQAARTSGGWIDP
jgi:hypothetical protein